MTILGKNSKPPSFLLSSKSVDDEKTAGAPSGLRLFSFLKAAWTYVVRGTSSCTCTQVRELALPAVRVLPKPWLKMVRKQMARALASWWSPLPTWWFLPR